MESGWYTRVVRNSFVLLVVLSLFSCNDDNTIQKVEKVANKSQLQSAYLVCRLGNGYFSNLFRLYASKEQKYSHIGILSKENDTVFVYHAEASELTGIGYVKRECIDSFLDGIKTFAFFQLQYPDSVKSQILDKVKSYHATKTAFDADFNNTNDSELYCTELIAVSINHALQRNEVKASLTVKGKHIYLLDDIYLMKTVKKVKY